MKTLFLAAALMAVAGASFAEGQPRSSETYQQTTGKVKTDTTPQNTASTAEGKRLPGRDCKFYEGGTRQHSFPQYEIGNPNRPECPSA